MPRRKKSELKGREVATQEPKATITKEKTSRRGGFRKPIKLRDFVVEYLQEVGEDHPSSIRQAYKARLSELGEERYKICSYYSFTRELQNLKREGLIEHSRREEASDSTHFRHFDSPPIRNYFKLAGRL